MYKTLLFLTLLATLSACAPPEGEDYSIMPMTNNPNVINVRQDSGMPGMNM